VILLLAGVLGAPALKSSAQRGLYFYLSMQSGAMSLCQPGMNSNCAASLRPLMPEDQMLHELGTQRSVAGPLAVLRYDACMYVPMCDNARTFFVPSMHLCHEVVEYRCVVQGRHMRLVTATANVVRFAAL
jgi:hypothetical protein